MKIFISGASGLVGGNCLKYFKEKNCEVIGTHLSFPTKETVYFNTLDLDNNENYDIMAFNPDVIIHCGALTHVDYCEEHIEESYQKTVQSTINLATIAHKTNAKFVLLSTDYVFDGKEGPYTETATLNPLSVYGKHKLEAESISQQTSENHLIIRVTNVYGDEIRNKNFIARIIDQCVNDQTLNFNLPIDQYASPTNAWDIARAIYELCLTDKKGIFHIGSTDYMNRVNLALKVIQYFPKAIYHLNPMTTAAMQQQADRPLMGGFICLKFNTLFPEFVFSTVDQYLQKKIRQLSV